VRRRTENGERRWWPLLLLRSGNLPQQDIPVASLPPNLLTSDILSTGIINRALHLKGIQEIFLFLQRRERKHVVQLKNLALFTLCL
jgi:hypothetical protein